MSTVQETPNENLSSVYSILHDIQTTLSNRFPKPTAPYLHPYIRNQNRQPDASWPTDRERLLENVKGLRQGAESFRAIWKGEQIPEGASTADTDDQRKTVLLRIMQDWCSNQHALLPVSTVLGDLLARSRTYAHPTRTNLNRTPFVQPQTLSSPTNRLVALAQSINLEVSLDNEDPSFGMGTGEDNADQAEGAQEKSIRVDTLALAGQRMVIDVEIAHPSSSASSGWRVQSLRVERVDPEHVASVGGMDVNLPPASAEGTGTRLLQAQSRVLEEYLQQYLDSVNAYDEAERRWTAGEEETIEGETRELAAERAVLAFGEQLRDLRAIDLKMKPLDDMAAGADVDMEAGRGEVVLWDQLDELHALIQSIPDMTITSPTILPTFRPFAHDTYLDNPTCRLVLSGSATVPPSSIASLAEWAMEFDTPVLVSNAFFGRAEEAGQAAPEVTLESLCGIDPSKSYHFQGDSGIHQCFLFPRSRVAGIYVDYVGVRSKDDIVATARAIRKALWTSRLLRSCVSEMTPVDEGMGDLDDELDGLLTGNTTKSKDLAISVSLDKQGISLSFPLQTPLPTETPVMMTLKVQPDGDGLNVSFSTDAPEGDWVSGKLEVRELREGLMRVKGDVPAWLNAVWQKLYS